MKFKTGDRILVLPNGQSCPEGMGVVVDATEKWSIHVKLDDHDNIFWISYDCLSLQKPQYASITTEKVMRGGKKCRRIIKFNNIKQRSQLPEEYFAGDRWFYLSDRKENSYHDVKSDGKCDWQLGGDVNRVVLGPNKPTLNLEGYCLIFTESSVLPEAAFQKIVAYMREAGELYRKVRIAREWSGVEEVIL